MAEQKLSLLNRELVRKQDLLEEDLEAAAGIQKALLPKMPTSAEKLHIAWRFEPCEHVGGDIFNLFWLDDERRYLGCYVLDMSGHGVPEPLERGGTIVGIGEILPFEAGDKLILYTDGITEYQNREGTLFGDDRFRELLEQVKGRPVAKLVKDVYEELMSFGDGEKIQDDVTLMGFEFIA